MTETQKIMLYFSSDLGSQARAVWALSKTATFAYFYLKEVHFLITIYNIYTFYFKNMYKTSTFYKTAIKMKHF